MSDLNSIDFETLTPAQFESILPDLFSAGEVRVSEDPRLQSFYAANPDALALVKDLETIARHARSLFEDEPEVEPSDDVWKNIVDKLNTEPDGGTPAPSIV